MRRRVVFGAVLAAAVGLAGCRTANSIALEVGGPPEGAVEARALETRRFETSDSAMILSAAAQTLQDLGFSLTESSSEVGVLLASKERSAEEAGEIAGQVVLTLAFALLGAYHNPDWDTQQTIVVNLVTTPIENSPHVDVRVRFDRLVQKKSGAWRAELIHEPGIYQEFFERLSKGVMLEGHQI